MSLICCFLDTATPEIYTYCHPLSLHDALPISGDVQLSMIQKHKPADAVIISTPQDLALIDATRAVCLFEQADIPMIGLVENMRSEEHTSELQSLMRISYAVFCLKKKQRTQITLNKYTHSYENNTSTQIT